MRDILTLSLIASTIRLSTPLVLAALGGLFSERSGVINIALEGKMLAGAFTAAALTHAVDTRLGMPGLLSGAFFLSSGSTPQIRKDRLLPQSPVVIAFAVLTLVAVIWYVVYKTPFGLRLRSVGENPEAADAAGVSVSRIRYSGVLIAGALAGIGGAYLSIGQSSLFTRNMTSGRGFIALAALIFGKWRPVQTMLACVFFGFTEAMTIQMQGVVKLPSGDDIPVQFVQMVPYVLTIVVLAGFIGHSRPPRALGRPYQKEL